MRNWAAYRAMSNTKKARAINLAMGSMGPQEGIARQIRRAHFGRTCAAARLHLPEKCVRHEAEIIFAHQDEFSTVAWDIQQQDEQDLRAARMVDLYDDGPYWPY